MSELEILNAIDEGEVAPEVVEAPKPEPVAEVKVPAPSKITTAADAVVSSTARAWRCACGELITAGVTGHDNCAAPVQHERPCALDDAPAGSKLVVLDSSDGTKVPTLNTPSGEAPMALNDVAYTLPVGAKVRKVMQGRIEATQLNHNVVIPPLVTLTAREAIAQFVPHFHR